jgi:phosphoglucosamine mutase
MAKRIFGTDGVRGRANEGFLSSYNLVRLAQSIGLEFISGHHRHLVVIGKDTRLSGYMVEPALTSGFISAGFDVVLVGPMPTPAIAMLVQSLRADLGIMISASHNPSYDNGIKIFGPDGYKLPDRVEKSIENRFHNFSEEDLPPAEKLGHAKRLDDALGRYIEHVKTSFAKDVRLDGLKIVMDCAHGAGYKIAPTILWELGAEVIPLGVKPDGHNINKDCGATKTDMMRQAVIDHQAHVGISLDGDGDRVIFSDEKGQVVDGDQILAMIGTLWSKQGLLKNNTVVATVMSNLGLEKYFETQGITMLRTDVGDRYVIEAMRQGGFNIGGEQSGHIIIRDYSTTGDGLVAMLQVLRLLVQEQKPASKVFHIFTPIPQIMKNYRYGTKNLLQKEKVQETITSVQAALQEAGGRLLIRTSGTEPLIRVMGECSDGALMEGAINHVLDALEKSDQREK